VFLNASTLCYSIIGTFAVADLEGAGPSPLSPEIYHLILVKLKISYKKYHHFIAVFDGCVPLFEISGSATDLDNYASSRTVSSYIQ
jgi:hypothetical protein